MNQDKKIAQLFERVKQLDAKVKHLQNVEMENVILRNEVVFLRNKLLKYENPKNSANSSIPPSKDENRPLKTKSLRKQTGGKIGGQKGHEGNTLKMIDSPSQIIEHVPNFCGKCGCDLHHVSMQFKGRRQVVDIPIIQPEYTEHRIFEKKCCCGHATSASYPQNVNAPISYGANTESLVGYLHSRHYIPFARMRELFNDAFCLPISEGGIHELLNRLAAKAVTAYNMIKEKIAASKVVGADETGLKINGQKCWVWTWQNDKITFITPSGNRGFDTIKTNFENGFKSGVLVHDCWKSHFKTPAKNHQICTAHLLRELNYFIEVYKEPWAKKFRELILDALLVKKKMEPNDYYNMHPPRNKIESRFEELLQKPVNEKKPDLVSFHKRMRKYKEFLFNFLHFPDVPPDNNGSERAIRNIKVKQKISGQFKSMKGAMNFAILRSISDTAIKNGQNVLNSLFVIANLSATD